MRQSALGICSDALPHISVDLFLRSHEGGAKELVLILPVQIDSALGNASRAGHVVYGRLAKPPPHQESGGGVQNMLGALRAHSRLCGGRRLACLCTLVSLPACDHWLLSFLHSQRASDNMNDMNEIGTFGHIIDQRQAGVKYHCGANMPLFVSAGHLPLCLYPSSAPGERILDTLDQARQVLKIDWSKEAGENSRPWLA
jgi:hypothetical protein